MNVYRNMTYGSTLLVLVLMTVFLVAEIWVMKLFPTLNRTAIHLVTVVLFLAALQRAAKKRNPISQENQIEPMTGEVKEADL